LSLAVLLVAMAIRPVYIYLTELLIRAPKRAKERPDLVPYKRLSGKELLVTSWAGMRGVVTLAAAAAIPHVVNGQPFAERATVQLAAYVAAIGTLLIQGLTLPWLIRVLRITNEDEQAEDDASEARVRLLATRAAADVVRGQVAAWAPLMGSPEAERIATWATQGLLAREAAAATLMHPETDAIPQDSELLTRGVGGSSPSLIADVRDAIQASNAEDRVSPTPMDKAELRERAAKMTVWITDLRTQMIRAQRSVVVAERNAGRLNETVMRRILRELDLEEESMEASWANRL
jgi:CPA1 family monovalent cation:H+ antiporter